MGIWEIIILILIIMGIFFTFAGVVGILRMPDTLCRLQSSTNIATMGSMPIALACSIYGFLNNNISIGIKSLIIIFFLLITNPVASHAMAKAAYKHLDEKSNKVKYDHYGRDIK